MSQVIRKLALALAAFACVSLASCASFRAAAKDEGTKIAKDVVADCLKPEIAQQVPNVIGSISQVINNQTTAEAAKQDELEALKQGGDEVFACALRKVLSDFASAASGFAASAAPAPTTMKTFAAPRPTSPTPYTDAAAEAAANFIREHAYQYADGWSPDDVDAP